jgi:DegV family protein with EDD domain
MRATKVVTGGYPGLPLETLVEHSIGVIPLHVTGLHEELSSEVNLDPIYGNPEELELAPIIKRKKDRLYSLLWERKAQRAELPGTSQPDEDSVREMFQRLLQDYDRIVCINYIHKDGQDPRVTYSGTHATISRVAAEYKGRIISVCSNTASVGIGLLAIRASKLAQQGLPAEEIAGEVERMRAGVHCYLALADTYFASQGGRVKHFEKLVLEKASTTRMNEHLVPLLNISDSHVGKGGFVVSVLGSNIQRNVNRALVKKLPDRVYGLGVVYTSEEHSREPAELLAKEIQNRLGIKPTIAQMGPAIGVHGGPKAWGMGYIL